VTRACSPRPLEAVLFDFDHTLAHLGDCVDWEAARAEALPLYRAAGVPDASLQATPGIINLYASVARAGLLEARTLAAVQADVSRLIGRYEAAAIEAMPVIPGALECLRALAATMPLGLVTSNATAVVTAILEHAGVADLLAVVTGRDEVVELKPSPEGIRLACVGLGVDPARAAYVGDMPADIEAAVRAGALPVGVLTGLGTREALAEAGAALILDSVEDVPAALA
jgi:HAD superfamily hydrolase (TIGR01509 family)